MVEMKTIQLGEQGRKGFMLTRGKTSQGDTAIDGLYGYVSL